MPSPQAAGNSGKIFGIGLSKTGTTSLYAALCELGYRSGTFRHLRELQLADWFRGDFSHDYLRDLDALTDLPIGVFFPQLDQKYPGSRFILTVRDIDSWLTSVARQFSRQPEPEPGFRRDVRMAAYGTSVFHEQRFRFVYKTHQRNVKWYFDNRPQDLLVMDICGGDGWDKLCHFLNRDRPSMPFPHQRPGSRKSLKISGGPKNGRDAATIRPLSQQTFAFVIPVRNPRDSKVKDYATVLALLKKTIHSLLQQTHPNIQIVIVGHGAPEWCKDLEPRVTFLDVSNCTTFKPDGLYKNIDKGLRWTTGVMYARNKFSPELVMLLDADDYVHVQLATHLLRRLRDEPDDVSDGFLVDQGVHALVQVDSNHAIRYRNAFAVRDFNRSCGSCRIFKTGRFIEALREIDPDIESRFQLWDAPDDRRCVRVPDEYVKWLFQETQGFHQSEQGILGVVGRHGKQDLYFQLVSVAMPGAAKSCGHGNHEGSRQGAPHWERMIQPISLKHFFRDFGIEPDGGSVPCFSRLRGWFRIMGEKLRSLG